MSVQDSQYTTQDSQASEDWPTEEEEEEEEEYDDYDYGEDADIVSIEEEGEARDVSFQRDPEYFEFSCLSTEETWNFLNSRARDVGEQLKVVQVWDRGEEIGEGGVREGEVGEGGVGEGRVREGEEGNSLLSSLPPPPLSSRFFAPLLTFSISPPLSLCPFFLLLLLLFLSPLSPSLLS